ncbi:Cof-type HAD-IIB family hydrolase [Virgibacillus halophilus]|uniref:Cof-type HAD-IIB family hydrolase n=1 Tax=Tigheibacillus halophilus TaxID=361280 RepID=UPI00363125C1
MADKSIIFFDIDGTLLNHEKQLPSSTKTSISQLKEKGHEVAIATGRAPFMFKDLRTELDIHHFVSYNGQYVVLNDEVIYTNPLDGQALEKLTAMALEHEHPVVFMDHEDMRANVPEHDYIIESLRTLQVEMPAVDPAYSQGRPLYQTLLFCPEGEEEQYEEAFPEFDFIRWHPVSVDVIPKGGSKANGIEQIVRRLGFAKEQQYAFGDGLNDIEMLSELHHSVAMGNALPVVKKAAKYVTASVEDDGIWRGLQLVGLL